MVSLKDDFDKSYKLLFQYKKIVIPALLSVFIPILLITTFFVIAGINLSSFQEVTVLMEEFTATHPEFQGENVDEEAYEAALSDFMKEKNYQNPIDKALENSTLLIVFSLIGFIVFLYFTSMSYAFIAILLKKKKYTKRSLFEKTNKYALKWIALELLIFLIFGIPALVLAFTIIPIFSFNTVLGIASIVVVVIAFVIYGLIIYLRLFFSVPVMYLDEKGPVNAIKTTYKVTKGHFRHVLLVFLLTTALSFATYGLRWSVPLTPLSGNVLTDIFGYLVYAVVLLIEVFVTTFIRIFVFYSYVDIDKLEDTILKK